MLAQGMWATAAHTWGNAFSSANGSVFLKVIDDWIISFEMTYLSLPLFKCLVSYICAQQLLPFPAWHLAQASFCCLWQAEVSLKQVLRSYSRGKKWEKRMKGFLACFWAPCFQDHSLASEAKSALQCSFPTVIQLSSWAFSAIHPAQLFTIYARSQIMEN